MIQERGESGRATYFGNEVIRFYEFSRSFPLSKYIN
jgi:hypothetical protein